MRRFALSDACGDGGVFVVPGPVARDACRRCASEAQRPRGPRAAADEPPPPSKQSTTPRTRARTSRTVCTGATPTCTRRIRPTPA